MCRSQAEGGQRCHTHTAKALAVAQERMVEANATYLATSMTDPNHKQALQERDRLIDEWHDAVITYASTPKGQADLQERLTTAPRMWDPYKNPHVLPDHNIEEALHRGKRLRERNEAVRKALQDADRRTNPYALKNRKVVTAVHRTHAANGWRRDEVQEMFDDLVTRHRTELAVAYAEKHRRAPRGDDARQIRWRAELRARTQFPDHIQARINSDRDENQRQDARLRSLGIDPGTVTEDPNGEWGA